MYIARTRGTRVSTPGANRRPICLIVIASCSRCSDPLPELSCSPHQPSDFTFPKRSFGKTAIVCSSLLPVFVYWSAQRDLLYQACRVLQLVLVMPATNATSERSFSALRRVKGYLRSTMSQQRLNNLMVLHVHKERTETL